MLKRVVVTGIGMVTPIGTGRDLFWKNALAGISGVKAISGFDAKEFRTRIGGECRDFDVGQVDYEDATRVDRVCQIALYCASEALTDSGLNPSEDETAVILGTGIGGISTIDKNQEALHLKGPRYVHPMTVPMSMFNASASHICIRHQIRGPSFTVSTACSSGSNAIGEAFRMIQHGYVKAALAGGNEAPLSYGMFSSWNALRVMSARNDDPAGAVRPFSKDRDGLVLSEGAAIVVLEEMESAMARGAPIYAEMVGYGSNNDGYHATRPSIDGQMKAIRKALQEARLNPEDIDYVNAHGTGTLTNDSTETEALKVVLGERARQIPVSSIKSMLGHALGASGAIEFAASCLTIRNGVVPPTINLQTPDPKCDLDYVPNEARDYKPRALISNTFGFGGCNAILALSALD